jgi:hypothetical protein
MSGKTLHLSHRNTAMNLVYVKPKHISLKNHPEFDEKWVQTRIADDPSILGLGELEIKDLERRQPKAGRLDILLRDPDTGKRYEVEVMLGAVDPSHIIRTLEYWDNERKRFPQYDHCAVIVAEDITSRFLNVISLFNSSVPIIALQMNALQVDDKIVLDFAKVLDEISLGEDDEDDGMEETTDRPYWEQRSSPESMNMVDECLKIVQEVCPGCDLKYNKYYIGLTLRNRTNNFVVFRPKKNFLRIEAKISAKESWAERIEATGMVLMQGTYSKRLRFTSKAAELETHRNLLKELFAECYQAQES